MSDNTVAFLTNKALLCPCRTYLTQFSPVCQSLFDIFFTLFRVVKSHPVAFVQSIQQVGFIIPEPAPICRIAFSVHYRLVISQIN